MRDCPRHNLFIPKHAHVLGGVAPELKMGRGRARSTTGPRADCYSDGRSVPSWGVRYRLAHSSSPAFTALAVRPR